MKPSAIGCSRQVVASHAVHCAIAIGLLAGPALAGGRLAAQDPTVIIAGRLLDPASGTIARNQRILVAGGRIVEVGPLVHSRPDARVVDLSRYTVLPGLVDAHVHLGIGGSLPQSAMADLRAGFTTVVDLGDRTQRVLRFRDSIVAGQLPGPRVLAAGIWVGTKNGVCEFGGIGIAGGPEAFAARVRENIRAGADLIKVCVSGWPADSYAWPDSVQISQTALLAVVREAHAAGKLVLAHAISLGAVRASLDAGVDGLAHAAYLDSATAVAVRERGVFLVPTLASLTTGDTTAASRALTHATILAYRAGVPLVLGTDGGVLPHGQNALEIATLVAAGVAPIDAIRAATTNAARALRLSDSVGAIRAGMAADIIAVDGDPLAEPAALQQVRFVMLGGREVELR